MENSFKNAIAGLDLSDGEELDLLTRYLGKPSAEQVRQIKTVNIRNLSNGLRTAWECLDERAISH